MPRRRRQGRYDATVVEIPICTEPRRHRGRKPDSELVVATARTDDGGPVSSSSTAGNGATPPRPAAAWLSERLGTAEPIPTADAFPLAVATWIDSAPYAVVEQASPKLLGIDRLTASGDSDHASVAPRTTSPPSRSA